MGSEMCIRDRDEALVEVKAYSAAEIQLVKNASVERLDLTAITCPCLLYTSDAADERSSVDLGGRRIIKTKKLEEHS